MRARPWRTAAAPEVAVLAGAGALAPEPALSRVSARGAIRASASPDRARGLGHPPELGALLVGRDAVALHGGGEAALGGQRQPVERHERRRGFDPPAELVHRLEPRLLRRHQPEHHLAILGHGPERLEAAGALVVVL